MKIPEPKLTPITVNTKGLMELLGCGKPSALKIGNDAKAKIVIGRRILWSVEAIKRYVSSIAE